MEIFGKKKKSSVKWETSSKPAAPRAAANSQSQRQLRIIHLKMLFTWSGYTQTPTCWGCCRHTHAHCPPRKWLFIRELICQFKCISLLLHKNILNFLAVLDREITTSYAAKGRYLKTTTRFLYQHVYRSGYKSQIHGRCRHEGINDYCCLGEGERGYSSKLWPITANVPYPIYYKLQMGDLSR